MTVQSEEACGDNATDEVAFVQEFGEKPVDVKSLEDIDAEIEGQA